MNDRLPKKLTVNQQTTVSIALVASLCMGAFWTGVQLTRLTLEVDHIKVGQSELKALSQKLADIAKQNQTRLNYLEDKE